MDVSGHRTRLPSPEKRARVLLLLRTYTDARETLATGSAGGDSDHDSKLHRMSEMWRQGSYPELERVLRLLLVKSPCVYRHVRDRYLARERVVVRRKWLRANEEPTVGDREEPGYVLALANVTEHEEGQGDFGALREQAPTMVVWRWRPGVSERIVDLGVDWLACEFRGWPRVPAEWEEAA